MSTDRQKYGFLSALEASKIKEAGDVGRARWRLLSALTYNSKLYGMIVVPAGFDTDFASVPRLPLIYSLTGDTAHASAVIHDYLVRGDFQVGLISWALAADVFLEAMKKEKVPAWRRNMMYLALRMAGTFK